MGRNKITELFYPNPMTVQEFYEEIIDSRQNFLLNCEKLYGYGQKMYAEEWIDLFKKWMEMNK